MNAMDTYKDEMSLSLFGRSRTLALAGAQCVVCGGSATEFRDSLSRTEWKISGACQACQDRFFDEDMTDEG